jgi:hypothetical protein
MSVALIDSAFNLVRALTVWAHEGSQKSSIRC